MKKQPKVPTCLDAMCGELPPAPRIVTLPVKEAEDSDQFVFKILKKRKQKAGSLIFRLYYEKTDTKQKAY
jgi:hypothetical protein